MIVGILKLVLYFRESNSLKEKRMVLEGLKKRLRNKFNISVLEIDDVDKWQKSTIAIVNVAKDKRFANSTLSNIISFLDDYNSLQLLDYEMELI